ncbi:MAG TPA: STAS domain-containing protein, partial [Roseiarcus sp.]|nr:STAS domain-containing protein [Roseiarcus sp.]
MPKKPVCAKRAGKVRAARAAPAVESDSQLAAAPDSEVRHAAAPASDGEAAAPDPDSQAAVPASDGEAANANDQPVRLPQILDLAAAAPLARELLSRRGKPTVIDALGVERPGAPCLQVLLAAIRTWKGDAVPLTFANCAPPLIEHLQFL